VFLAVFYKQLQITDLSGGPPWTTPDHPDQVDQLVHVPIAISGNAIVSD